MVVQHRAKNLLNYLKQCHCTGLTENKLCVYDSGLRRVSSKFEFAIRVSELIHYQSLFQLDVAFRLNDSPRLQ